MSREDRAKQFMPFAALKGYSEALRKKERIIVPRRELSEEYGEELDRKLRQVQEGEMISVVYYCRGEYVRLTGKVAKIDKEARMIRIVNEKIAFDDLYALYR
ncbi:MAG: YolD-like family protein [Frisingicoccus sp.]|nr:YolD-like family protein [Frisingicoccus sp.]MDD6233478.1 YolD-like family protein [Frisingicoccus sp.]